MHKRLKSIKEFRDNNYFVIMGHGSDMHADLTLHKMEGQSIKM